MIPQMEPLLGEKERKAVDNYMRSGGFLTEYKETEKFEKQLASFLDVPYVSMVTSGTAALYLSTLAALTSIGLNKMDYEFLVPDYTMIASANAVRMTGARVKLVDIEKDSFCMDINEAVMNQDKTKGMIFVDINGRGGMIEEAVRYCRNNNIVLIEDACQAFGSKHKGKHLGTFGRFGCFSLSFHKIITTGEGGFIVTHNKKDYELIERLKNFGRLKGGNDIHKYLGFNFLYTDLQAVIGMAQLTTIEGRINKKKEVIRMYTGIQLIDDDYVPWFMEILCKNKNIKDGLIKRLDNNGIKSRPFYPPLHTQPIYTNYKSGYFPVASDISKRGLWLPSSLTLTKDQVRLIKGVINENL